MTINDKMVARMEGPVESAFNITPSDSVDLTHTTRAIIVASAGNMKATTVGGTTVTFPNLVAGIFHPIRVTRIWATGTGASGIMGCY